MGLSVETLLRRYGYIGTIEVGVWGRWRIRGHDPNELPFVQPGENVPGEGVKGREVSIRSERVLLSLQAKVI
jgi:hypothetical protein